MGNKRLKFSGAKVALHHQGVPNAGRGDTGDLWVQHSTVFTSHSLDKPNSSGQTCFRYHIIEEQDQMLKIHKCFVNYKKGYILRTTKLAFKFNNLKPDTMTTSWLQKIRSELTNQTPKRWHTKEPLSDGL